MRSIILEPGQAYNYWTPTSRNQHHANPTVRIFSSY